MNVNTENGFKGC